MVLVHFHTPRLLVRAIEAAVADLDACGMSAEWIVVDNGSDQRGRAILDGLGVKILDPGRNVGYAGGINRGVEATTAPLLCLMNPDVEVFPGCMEALASALEAGAAVAGPRLFLDSDGRLEVPPTERRTRRHELLRVLASRGPRWAKVARRAWRRHARHYWRATAPLETTALTGALLLVRRDAWNHTGPFDERYPLYFEETDWLLRLRRRRLSPVLVPQARGWHRHDASGAHDREQAARWAAESFRRFARRHYGPLFYRTLKLLSAGATGPTDAVDPDPEPPSVDLRHHPASATRPLWIELSRGSLGFPAAAERLLETPTSGVWTLPSEVWDGLAPGWYRLTLVDEEGREVTGLPVERVPHTPAMARADTERAAEGGI